MENLKRPYQLKFRVNKEEKEAIEEKMKQIGIRKFAVFARRIILGGLVVNPIVPGLDEALVQMSRIGNNINQAVRRMNASDNPSQRDIDILKTQQKELWQLLKSIESTLR